jgi:hypothetical protein
MNNIFSDLHDLPAFNWFRATQTKDFSWLLIDRTQEFDQEELEQVFKDLNNQLIDEFGISDNYLNYLMKQRALNIAKAKWLLSQNNFDQTMMMVAEQQLQEITKQFGGNPNKFSEKISAERILGFRIDMKQVSVVEYYNYLNEADKIAKQMTRKK